MRAMCGSVPVTLGWDMCGRLVGLPVCVVVHCLRQLRTYHPTRCQCARTYSLFAAHIRVRSHIYTVGPHISAHMPVQPHISAQVSAHYSAHAAHIPRIRTYVTAHNHSWSAHISISLHI